MEFWTLLILLGGMAFLYASVGHGGASGYLAVLAIFAVAPAVMKQTALVLNLGVSLLAFYQFYRQKYFRFELFWPFALTSVPMSYLGAQFVLSDANYKRILGICLVIAIVRMLATFKSDEQRSVSLPLALIFGAVIGLFSGMIGIGGGILLSPILLLMRWASLKEAAAISALFIFVNSVAGLFGLKNGIHVDQTLVFWITSALVGGMFGARWGAQIASNKVVKWVLALVLLIASVKLWFV
ncbi:sulfite exporter TauE/SafE family protein [Aquirufa sp. 5-AUSEE-100C1]